MVHEVGTSAPQNSNLKFMKNQGSKYFKTRGWLFLLSFFDPIVLNPAADFFEGVKD